MTRRLLSAVALLLLTGASPAPELGPVDWIFLVDTSMSMRGVGKGTKDIFADVQGSIDTFVREANNGDTVAIYAFDKKVRLQSAMPIDAKARTDLHAIVAALEAEGNRTHLGAAIAEGLKRAASLPKDPQRRQAIVLFTDGKEDVRDIENPTRIDANLARGNDAYIYFVSMGEHEPQLDAFDAATPRTTVMKVPTAEAIREVATNIRATIPKPPPPPPPPPPPGPAGTTADGGPSNEGTSFLAPALFTLAILAATAFTFLHLHRKNHRLEGELEILRPIPAADAAYVGLPKLQATEIALSAILPTHILAGSDARLFVRRRAGRKKVWISATGGSLRVNDVETPLSELYDADTIEIGDAKLRFNRVGDERQEETL